MAAAGRGVAGSAISQGIGVATGLQSKFSFAGVAASAVGAEVGSQVGGLLNVESLVSNNSIGNHSAVFATSAATVIANAATRSAIEGSNFGDNIQAAVPDVIAQAIFDIGINGINTSVKENPSKSKADTEGIVESRHVLEDRFNRTFGLPTVFAVPDNPLLYEGVAFRNGGGIIDGSLRLIKEGFDLITGKAQQVEVIARQTIDTIEDTLDEIVVIGNRTLDNVIDTFSNPTVHNRAVNDSLTATAAANRSQGRPAIISNDPRNPLGSPLVDLLRTQPPVQDFRNAAGQSVSANTPGAIAHDIGSPVTVTTSTISAAPTKLEVVNNSIRNTFTGAGPVGLGDSLAVGYLGVNGENANLARAEGIRNLGNIVENIAVAGRFSPRARTSIPLTAPSITGFRTNTAVRPSPEAQISRFYQESINRNFLEISRDVSNGIINLRPGVHENTRIGQLVDNAARRDLIEFTRDRGFGDDIVRINRRLNIPDGGFRIPDVFFPRSGNILDGTIGIKTARTPQIQGFQAANNGGNIRIVRPVAVGQSYNIP